VDKLSPTKRSEIMRNIRGKDTAPEMAVRSLVHRMGYRYRLHAKDLPGKPDMVFRSKRKVIFVHGCFWHLHEGCRKAAFPKSKKRYWVPKLLRNRERDERILQELKTMGWKALVIWQCQLAKKELISRKINRFLAR